MRALVGTTLFAAGCGLFEGVESPLYHYPCRELSRVEEVDLTVGTTFLDPAAERLDGLLGAYAVEAVREGYGPLPSTFPGTFTLTAAEGPVVAVESEVNPDEIGGLSSYDPVLCGSSYQVPVQAALELDGDLLRVNVAGTLYLRETTPWVVLEGPWTEDAGALTGTLAEPYGLIPESVGLYVDFLDGSVPTGRVMVHSGGSTYLYWVTF